MRELLRRRWEELPASVRTPNQLAGVGGVACGATHGIHERCNFACTSCYLSDVANRTPSLPFEEVRAQLETLRAYLGSGGKVQITSGEVSLLPLEELGRIVAHARALGLDPMVMSHGERFLEEPRYLEELVGRYGLRKVSIHVDSTQRGRAGWVEGMRERELHPIRDRYAQLIRDTRRATGEHLHAAHTVTLTPHNLADVPDIVEWALANVDAFRMLSFLPAAEVGRTRDRSQADLTMQGLWERICQPIGRLLHRDAMRFGHPECNLTVPTLVLQGRRGLHVFEGARADSERDARAYARGLRNLSTAIDLDDGHLRNLGRVLARLMARPWLLGEAASYAVRRAWSDRRLLGALLDNLVRGRGARLYPLMLVVHKFMDAQELETEEGRERLAACVFKLPVDGRMVSMCEMNASGMRRDQNERQRALSPQS